MTPFKRCSRDHSMTQSSKPILVTTMATWSEHLNLATKRLLSALLINIKARTGTSRCGENGFDGTEHIGGSTIHFRHSIQRDAFAEKLRQNVKRKKRLPRLPVQPDCGGGRAPGAVRSPTGRAHR